MLKFHILNDNDNKDGLTSKICISRGSILVKKTGTLTTTGTTFFTSLERVLLCKKDGRKESVLQKDDCRRRKPDRPGGGKEVGCGKHTGREVGSG